MTQRILYVCPSGNDSLDGNEPAVNGVHGPLKTLTEAMRRLADMDWRKDGDACIVLRGGRHELSQPLTLTPALCGCREWLRETGYEKIPVNERRLRFEAFPDEYPVISGAKAITDWKPGTLNGRNAWVASAEKFSFSGMICRQLFINGRRRQRARWPKEGFLRVRDIPAWVPADDPDRPAWMQGQDHFRFFAGDIKPWSNWQDAEVVFLQRWIESRTGLRNLDFHDNMALLDRPAKYSIIHDGVDPDKPEGARFYVENVLEELCEPGEWALDRKNGLLYYLPMPGETPDSVEALVPILPHLVKIQGNMEKKAIGVSFNGICFSHTEWSLPAGVAGSTQSSCETPGTVILDNAVDCEFQNCDFKSTAAYGLEMLNGSSENRVERCIFDDLGAGGIKIWHDCRRNLVCDCEIRNGGRIFHSGTGILVGKSAGNRILRNRIHDLYYTGIAVGWVWGYKESESYGNIIEYNHVYDIGKDWLSDMGGIYLLGMAPGTRIRFNVIHDVRSAVYGGVGIYPDEGSTDLLIEGNLIFDCRSFLISQHFGRRNTFRENLLVDGEENQVGLHRIEPGQTAFIFERNILCYRNGMAFSGGYMNKVPDQTTLTFRNNIYWPIGLEAQFMGMGFETWRNDGIDAGSEILNKANVSFTALREKILGGLEGVPGLDKALLKLRSKSVYE